VTTMTKAGVIKTWQSQEQQRNEKTNRRLTDLLNNNNKNNQNNWDRSGIWPQNRTY